MAGIVNFNDGLKSSLDLGYTPLQTPGNATNFSSLSSASRDYINKKMGYDFGNLEKYYGADAAFNDINVLLKRKGGQQISDWSQADAALAPLIKKRNAGGIGNVLGSIGKIALPIAAGLLVPGLGSALAGTALGSSLGAIGSTALAGAGVGGLSAALTGGNILEGAALGGVGGGLQGAGGLSGVLGTAGKAKLGGLSGGTGILGSLSKAGGTLGDIGTGISKGISTLSGIGSDVGSLLGVSSKSAPTTIWGSSGSGSLGSTTGGITMNNSLGRILSGVMEYKAQNDIANKLRKSQEAALQQISPYTTAGASANQQLSEALAAGFNPGDLSTDPGYQFRLNQGQRSLGQSLAARGLGQSGAALKAAQEYGQNFANNEYTDAYNRWLANNQQLNTVANRGYTAASEAGDILGNIGAVGAQGIAGRNNAISSTLSSLLSGRGIIGFDSMGNPVYG